MYVDARDRKKDGTEERKKEREKEKKKKKERERAPINVCLESALLRCVTF